MGTNVRKYGAVLCALLLTASLGYAADGDMADPGAVQPAPDLQGTDSHSITGFVDVRYRTSETDDPYGGQTANRGNDRPLATPIRDGGDFNEFIMAEAEVNFRGTMFGSRVDYKVDIEAFGGTAVFGPFSPFVQVEQANMTYSFEAGIPHSVTAGLFNASEMFGYEKLDAPNLNTISHSSMFTALMPKRLVGVIWQPHVDSQGRLNVKISATNPWDALTDSISHAHAYAVSASYLQPKYKVGASVINSREETSPSDEDRFAWDVWARYDPIQNGEGILKNLSFVAEVTSGTQEIKNVGPFDIGDHDWFGWNVEVHADFGGSGVLNKLGATIRVGSIDIETDGALPPFGAHVLTGDLIDDDGDPTNGMEGSILDIAVALDYQLTKKMKLTLEYRMLDGDTDDATLDEDGDFEFDTSSITLQLEVLWP